MKKFLLGIAAIISLLLVGVVAPTTASATPIPADAANPPFKFWTPNICIDGSAINGQYYQVAYLAQQWNLRTTTLALDYSTDCAADGYGPSARMVVGSFNNPDGGCIAITNGQGTYLNGWYRFTNGPGIYINVGVPGCVSSQARRDHAVSAAIGAILGLKYLNSSSYNSRVMNQTAWSYDNVTVPDQHSANTLDAIYSYAYCQPFGTTC